MLNVDESRTKTPKDQQNNYFVSINFKNDRLHQIIENISNAKNVFIVLLILSPKALPKFKIKNG